jgi:replicative DNA helicase
MDRKDDSPHETMTETPWIKQDQHFKDAITYLKGRRNGTITSLLTPWPKVNEATTNGIEWHSMTVIGGRPGTGKTTIKDQLIREAFPMNPASSMRVLEFSLEMLGKTSAIRGMSAYTGKSYKTLCSAESNGEIKITDEQLSLCEEFAEQMNKYPIDIVEAGPTVKEFEATVMKYMETHSRIIPMGTVQQKVFTNTVITLDHSLLLEVNKKEEKSKNDMLYNLGTTLTRLKRKYPIAFIILSQLNRSIDHPDRNEDGKYGNYVLESDIFGADALLQHADTVIGLNRPGKQKIRYYGVDRYIIPDEKLLAMHFLKCRNGENGIAFFNTKFEKMAIEEIPAPPKQYDSKITIKK